VKSSLRPRLVAAALLAMTMVPGTPARADRSQQPAPSAGTIGITIETALGPIVVALDAERAPITVANFLAYVDTGLFDGASFYRTVTPENQPQSPVKIEVIQGGVDDHRPTRAPIRLERTSETGLSHVDGAISMARNGPDTATSEFFICVGAQPDLDVGGRRNPDEQGFAAFGRVVRGMTVVRRIHRAPATEQRLTPAIRIHRIVRTAR
jgi:peptidyl-prolyl cis-trans isomerase A (cyclophilin A)